MAETSRQNRSADPPLAGPRPRPGAHSAALSITALDGFSPDALPAAPASAPRALPAGPATGGRNTLARTRWPERRSQEGLPLAP
ncbi:hypothetical protein [Streptomyces sp. NPDC056683]|uniref:hypothetical protein n=1 Tax=Streptomyces sp. NPDC056683 TaxID=3345910 RepID=UPI0036D05E3E